ncbi:membrane metalloprotease [Sabulilitoribacter multivorans]|uniref:Membrane metalloprotease n=1 Tax=Flaviramulus multivorans TaxID=1304750 RepID=A0ABS9IKG6_9FLAO|nr:membrane metalloprotease [Flaviramulus multivorans]MCF7561082.1 membrane metalloprotease [Flaviramulus multivorans]
MKYQFLIALFILSIISACSKDESANIDSDQPNPIDKNLNRKTTGSSANDLLSDAKFTNMIIELVYVEGFEPTQTAINNFVSFLNERTNKPGGITVEKRAIASSGKDVYTLEEIAQIEREQRQHYNTQNQIAIWAYFTDGKSENDSEANGTLTLGTAYWNTSFVIYEETIQGLSNSPLEPNRSLLETTVINHEFGHIFGLTNLGSPLQSNHEDTEHPKHCNVEDCLMYWATESAINISDMANMSSAPQLDAQCIADLQANGGK